MPVVSTSVSASVCVIALDQPPLNALNYAARVAFGKALTRAINAPEILAIIVMGTRRAFSCGADIAELGRPEIKSEPSLHTLIDLIERSPKPVMAVMDGLAIGGGLELALACHYRAATAATRLALPEALLGLLPGAGGTQRLPRALGLPEATTMIVTGVQKRADCFVGTPLIHVLAEDSDALLPTAKDYLSARLGQDQPHTLLRDLATPGGDIPTGLVGASPAATKACLEAMAAARDLPFLEALKVETGLFEVLCASAESAALRYAFAAERTAQRIAGIASDMPVREIKRVAVIGAGMMGSGIALVFLNAGLPVTMLDSTADALQRATKSVKTYFDRQVALQRLPADVAGARVAALSTSLSYGDIADADLLVEAVFESWAAKESVFRQMDRHAKPGAILATNTSTLNVDRIAEFTQRPADVLGMHFFSPAQIMRLVEVVRAKATSSDVLWTIMSLSRRLGKTAVVSGVCDGFIGNRMVEHYSRQAGFLLDEGALPEQVDAALEKWGMAMGPFRMNDMAGNDVSLAIRARRRLEHPEMRFSATADRLGELERHGQKSGAGWYDYRSGDRRAYPSPTVHDIVMKTSAAAGMIRREIDDTEIVARLILALVNEGARLLEEGIAARASDIDTVYVSGYGFPRFRGGPMWYADQLGLSNVIATMRRFQHSASADPAFWEPAPRLVRLAESGGRLTAAADA